jgi:hypothetical protein
VPRLSNRKDLRKKIPAEELGEFNWNIVGKIEVIAEFRSTPNQ